MPIYLIDFFDFMNNCIFLVNVLFVIMREMCIYFIFRDYDSLILNITSKLAEQNILYVKVFQAFALNNNIITDKMSNKLLQFTDNAPWNKNDINMMSLLSLEKEYNIKILNSYNPINSGMISLVFKGIKYDANESSVFSTVIIKLKRENIENTLNEAIKKMLFFIKILSFIPIMNNYQVSETIHNNIHLIRQQTNFHQEITNVKQMQKNSNKLKYVKIPDVYDEVTLKFPNIILMEYIDGKTIQNIDKEDYDAYAKQVVKFVLVTLFMHGICHGDLHVGNILFIKDEHDAKYPYKIGILDFGIVYKIEKTRDAFFYVFSNMCDKPPEEIVENTMLSGIIEPVDCFKKLNKFHYDNITQIFTKFINETVHVSKNVSQMSIFRTLMDLNNYIVSHKLIVDGVRIKASDDLVKFQVVLGMLHGVILTLCKNRYIELVNIVMRETFHVDASES
jgi:predicted unusual protein kinase regulating ubiquinone biosynthesis (AarF/ABC1/UbiB family)